MLNRVPAALLALAAPGAAFAQQAPNIVVVLLDDVGRDKIAFAGDHPQPAPTPHLDRLAARGLVFDNAWATPACSPTRASLISGQYTTRHGIGQVLKVADGVYTPFNPDTLTLPDALPGHTSAVIGKWHLDDSTEPAAHALRCGFDAAMTFVGANQYTGWTEDVNGRQAVRSGYYPTHAAPVVHRALKELPEPHFVLYAPFLAHAPFHEPPAALRPNSPVASDLPSRHRAMVEAADSLVGRVLQATDLERTYVFVIGDNGSPGGAMDGPFAGLPSKGTLYESGLRVPFLVAGPGVAAGERCDAPIQITDVFATCRELCGLGPAVGGAEDSISFASLLADPAAPGARSFLYAHRFPFPGAFGTGSTNGPARAIRTARWKLIDGAGDELFDLLSDPYETTNLLGPSPSAAALSVRDRLLALMPQIP